MRQRPSRTGHQAPRAARASAVHLDVRGLRLPVGRVLQLERDRLAREVLILLRGPRQGGALEVHVAYHGGTLDEAEALRGVVRLDGAARRSARASAHALVLQRSMSPAASTWQPALDPLAWDHRHILGLCPTISARGHREADRRPRDHGATGGHVDLAELDVHARLLRGHYESVPVLLAKGLDLARHAVAAEARLHPPELRHEGRHPVVGEAERGWASLGLEGCHLLGRIPRLELYLAHPQLSIRERLWDECHQRPNHVGPLRGERDVLAVESDVRGEGGTLHEAVAVLLAVRLYHTRDGLALHRGEVHAGGLDPAVLFLLRLERDRAAFEELPHHLPRILWKFAKREQHVALDARGVTGDETKPFGGVPRLHDSCEAATRNAAARIAAARYAAVGHRSKLSSWQARLQYVSRTKRA
mmetsp:Transcript_107536/g.304001  ORF Transcript_107536/g.304001 Transcript_107536/m.304001 type:complete len:417 (-) Transcript_107536:2-1252(-)